MSMSPLNKTLFCALEQSFGEVLVADPGCAMVKRYSSDGQGRRQLDPISCGEYYRVRCPYCKDWKPRLWINYLWGVYDKQTKTRNLWLAVCYNEDCLADPDNLEDLVEQTTWYGRRARARRVQIAEGHSPPPGKPILLPKDFTRLHQLPGDHPARQYVRQRRFDPVLLARRWAVGYSREACSWSPAGRLIIPIFRGRKPHLKYFGWQARAIEEEDEPKYYTAHGLKKSHVLYGLHRVADKGPVVICEGPTDVWRMGRNAIALLGKSPSQEQLRLIQEQLAGRPLVVVLDSDAIGDAVSLTDRLLSLRQRSLTRPDSAPVVQATLPDGQDPADCTFEEIQAAVREALEG